jgi:hypothetical protein
MDQIPTLVKIILAVAAAIVVFKVTSSILGLVFRLAIVLLSVAVLAYLMGLLPIGL